MQTLDITKKENIGYCIPTELRDEQIKINIRKVKGRLEPDSVLKTDPIAIVCFGPSLNETWEELKKFKYIISCSGAHKFLIDKGIIPTWHIDLEPREHKVKMLGTPHKDVEYLIASTIHPKYLDQLSGYNVKLWHIFANEEEGARVLPRGEWMITGGSSVGLRCMTIARFLGFTNLHIFGMDGSISEKSGSHTSHHPNAPKEHFETEYNGKKFITTPSILFCAKETFKELDQMPDVKATFHGDGLVQEMAKDYKPSPLIAAEIAYNKPELISEEYIHLNRKLHEDNPTYGMGGSKHAETVLKMYDHPDVNSILDYGCGKGMLAKKIPFPIWEYDPAIPEKSAPPKPADLVVCTDVLEHIEPDKLDFVLDDLKRCVKQLGYFVISTRQAIKTYANGQNTHLIVNGKKWWENRLSKFFNVAKIQEGNSELQIIVGPKTVKQPDITTIEDKGNKYKFYTPNDTTKWRADTLLKKEPSTIEWINSMKPGDVLFDIGANVGSYSVYAGVKGIKTYSFEPEADNYCILVKNLTLNKIEPNAYCLALSNEEKPGILYGGQKEVGGACHSFNESVGHDLQQRQSVFSQGCFGIPLDILVDKGLPSPQHIKIDVDGFEYKVVQGAKNVLMNGVESVLIEINPEIPQHREMILYMESLGFSYDKEQVERAKRKEGTFKGVAEYVFRKLPKTKLIEAPNVPAMSVGMAKLHKSPFPHLYIKELFTKEEYKELINNMPDNYVEIEKSRGTKGYPKRFTAVPNGEIWDKIIRKLTDGRFKKALLEKFDIKDEGFIEDILLVRDFPGYQIPPHTDSLSKVITVLIYLPKDDSLQGEGTSIYEPKKKNFTCKKGIHYKFEDFNKVKTMSFKPNSAFIFARTDNSFHGVEPCGHVRDVLLYNIKVK